MITYFDGTTKTTIDLRVWLVFFLVALASLASVLLFFKMKRKDLAEIFKKGEYKKVIKEADARLKALFALHPFSTPPKSLQREIENLRLMQAVSFLEILDFPSFLGQIDQLSNNLDEKHIWLSVYAIMQKDLIRAKKERSFVTDCQTNRHATKVLDGFLLCLEGDAENGKKLLRQVEETESSPLLQRMIRKSLEE